MSDTPRTDALEITCNRDCANYLSDLARTLERELVAAESALAEANEKIERLETYEFHCEAGPLKNCAEWMELKAILAKGKS